MSSSAKSLPANAIAPSWHTAALVALIVGVASAGTYLAGHGGEARVPTSAGRLAAYVPMVLVPWGLLVYVARVGRPRSALRGLLGARWGRGVFGDIVWGAIVFAVVEAAEAAFASYVRARGGPAPEDLAFLPRTAGEHLIWIAVAMSTAFGEEVVYRGYLQTQFFAWSRSRAFAVVVQALLFGLAHAEQGATTAARYAMYGAGLGVLALARRSLLAGILGHA